MVFVAVACTSASHAGNRGHFTRVKHSGIPLPIILVCEILFVCPNSAIDG